jgi:ubiquitin C-terminal hydrolase
LLNGGKAKLIGHRPATSQRPKKRTKESSCQTTGLTIRLFCSTVSIPRTPLKKVHLLGCARSHRAKELFKPFNTFKQLKNVEKHEYAPIKRWISRAI